jgi:hypothetical protein
MLPCCNLTRHALPSGPNPNPKPSPHQDLADARITVLTAGQSLLLPSGWIHAVFTPCDSCAILGWNRLQPRVLPAAAPCATGCSPVCYRLQPHVLEAASIHRTHHAT